MRRQRLESVVRVEAEEAGVRREHHRVAALAGAPLEDRPVDVAVVGGRAGRALVAAGTVAVRVGVRDGDVVRQHLGDVLREGDQAHESDHDDGRLHSRILARRQDEPAREVEETEHAGGPSSRMSTGSRRKDSNVPPTAVNAIDISDHR